MPPTAITARIRRRLVLSGSGFFISRTFPFDGEALRASEREECVSVGRRSTIFTIPLHTKRHCLCMPQLFDNDDINLQSNVFIADCTTHTMPFRVRGIVPAGLYADDVFSNVLTQHLGYFDGSVRSLIVLHYMRKNSRERERRIIE